jgi:hypothetical protein
MNDNHDTYIINPETNRKVKRNARKGKEIVEKYFKGGAVTTASLSSIPVCFTPKTKSLSSPVSFSPVKRSYDKPYSSIDPKGRASVKGTLCVLPQQLLSNANSCSSSDRSVLSSLFGPENYDIFDFKNALKFVYGQVQQHCRSKSTLDIDKDIFLKANGSPPTKPPQNLTSGSDCSFDMHFINLKSTVNKCNVLSICQIENITINTCVQQGEHMESNKDTLNMILKEFLSYVLTEICAEIVDLKDVNVMSLFQGILAGLLVESIVDLCNQSDLVGHDICNNKYAKIVGNVVFKMKMVDPKATVVSMTLAICKAVAKVDSGSIPLEGRIKGVIVDGVKEFIQQHRKKPDSTQLIVDQP